jgi:hypothetical protein
MAKEFIPGGNAEYREYMIESQARISRSKTEYKIPNEAVADISSLIVDYLTKDATASNPDQATKANRDARDAARKILTKEWRVFANKWLRYNDNISIADKEAFHIYPRDTTHTPAKKPKDKGIINVERLGAYEYEITVVVDKTGKRKLPEDATGSYLYLAVSEPGTVPENVNTYQRQKFSSNSRHILYLSPDDLARQANVFARYSNRHGMEGPAGLIVSFLIN